jgi:hypothetical protein
MSIFEKITSKDIRNIIAIITVIGAFILLYLMIIKPIPEGNKDTINIAIGFVFGGLVGGVSGYFFGSSKKDTDEVKAD